MENSLYPRPEYPRPDRQRGTIEGLDWLNLNGPWEFRFDGDRVGMDQQWYSCYQPAWRQQIIVPFCWESLAAWGEADAAGNDNYYSTRVFRNPLEVTRANHRSAPRYEVGWYKRSATIPQTEPWTGKRVILTVGAADFFTDCWCNGVYLGRHEGGYVPFEFDLTDALISDLSGHRLAHLVLRVEDPMENHEQPVGKQWRWYTTTSGIWQTVYVEPRHRTHLHGFQIFPDIEQVQIKLRALVAKGAGCCLIVEIIAPDGAKQEHSAPVSMDEVEMTIPLRALHLWDPNRPCLYRMTLRVQRQEQLVDRVESYFGMRKIDSAPAEDPEAPAVLRLNGVPRYLRGALYQSYWPEGVYTAGDAARLRGDIEAAKKFGFNFLRIHIKIDDPLLLYYADLLGIMLMADFPNFGEGGDTPLGRRRFETMMRAAMERDFNHPSIVAWCTFNETWGFGGQVELVKAIYKPAQTDDKPATEENFANAPVVVAKPSKLANKSAMAWVQEMWELAKRLDPTRLVEDMSVCHWDHLEYFGHAETDINSWHFYIHDYAHAKEHIAKVVANTYRGSTFNYGEGYEYRGQPLINSEYGGIGALDGDRDVSWSFKFLTNELRRHGRISAYIYTELHDVEWEYNGFLNYNRTPKQFGYDPRIFNESNAIPLDAPPVSEVAPGASVQVPVTSSHYSSWEAGEVHLQWRLSGYDTLGRLHQNIVQGLAPIPFPHRRVVSAHIVEVKMPAEPMLCTLSFTACTAAGTVVARNFVHYHVWQGPPPQREVTARSVILRQPPFRRVAGEWTGPHSRSMQEGVEDRCFGEQSGFFEWEFATNGIDWKQARRLRAVCEVSARRKDTPQTDDDTFATTLRMSINRVPVFEATIPNHPHDARGVLSYLRGGVGSYGYLVHALAEGALWQSIIAGSGGDVLRLRCEVPENAFPVGGLTIYGSECGRYPVCPTLILEF